MIFPSLKQDNTNGQFGNVSFGWVADGASAPSQEPMFDQVEIKTHEASAYTEFSRRVAPIDSNR